MAPPRRRRGGRARGCCSSWRPRSWAGCCWPAGWTCCCRSPRCSRSGCRTWARVRRSPPSRRSRWSRGGRRWRRRCRGDGCCPRRGRPRRSGRWRWRWSTAGSAGWSSGCPAARSTCTTCRGSTGVREMLATFADHILTDQPVHWTTHVGAHPPGVFLFYVVLDRVGLGGGGAAGVVTVLVGASACVAVAVTLRALGAEDVARRGAAVRGAAAGRGVGRGVGGRHVRRRAGVGRGAGRRRRDRPRGAGGRGRGRRRGAARLHALPLLRSGAGAAPARRRPGGDPAVAGGGARRRWARRPSSSRSPRPGSGGSPGSATSG